MKKVSSCAVISLVVVIVAYLMLTEKKQESYSVCCCGLPGCSAKGCKKCSVEEVRAAVAKLRVLDPKDRSDLLDMMLDRTQTVPRYIAPAPLVPSRPPPQRPNLLDDRIDPRTLREMQMRLL